MFDHRKVIFAILLVGLAALSPRDGEVRTWYVKADSTGDAPTIWAAVDSTVTGDTVLVGPGTYEFPGCIRLPNGITVRSEAGPMMTRIVSLQPPYHFPLCAFSVRDLWGVRTEVSGFWFEDFIGYVSSIGIINIEYSESVYVHHNVFADHLGTSLAVSAGPCNYIFVENNTFVGGSYAIRNTAGPTIGGAVRYNIIWSQYEGLLWFDWVRCNCIRDTVYVVSYNIYADPQFCGTIESGNLYIQSDSPCAPGNDPFEAFCDSVLIGALPVGCGTTPVKQATWGSIKSIYR
jgi:hypothetical protein